MNAPGAFVELYHSAWPSPNVNAFLLSLCGAYVVLSLAMGVRFWQAAANLLGKDKTMATWYYAKDGEQIGPVDEHRFAEMVRSGEIRPATLVWRAGMADWAPFRGAGWEAPADAASGEAKPEGGLRLQPGTQGANRPGFAIDPDPLPESTAKAPSPRLTPKQAQGGGPSGGLPGLSREAGRLQDHRARYHGQGGELFPLYLKNILLTLFTLGIYRFWAEVEVRKYHYRHTEFLGGRFDYHATGKERLLGFCKGLLVILPLAGLAYLLFRWAVGSGFGEAAFSVTFLGVYAVMALLRPLIIVGTMAFRLSRTSWNNMRFHFTGRVGELYGIFLRDFFLMIITLGLYNFWHQANVMRYQRENSQIGGVPFRYGGSGGDLLGISFVGIFLSYITLGIYFPWFVARLMRYHIEQTTFQGARFRSSLTGGQVLGTGLACIFQIVFTLGIGMPWAIARWRRLITDTTSAYGVIDPSRLAGSFDGKANAFAEGLGEAGEMLESIGEIFGG